MTIKIINRKYLIGGKWIRLEEMRGLKLVGWKIAIFNYEVRLYI